MLFCTQCGNKMHDENKFCAKCGTPASPPIESIERTELESFKEVISPKHIAQPVPQFIVNENEVDRKTLFDEGMLILTSQNIILYSSDEKEELKRIPISSIESCSYSNIRRSLVIKHRTNEQENYDELLVQKQSQFSDIKFRKEFYQDKLKNMKTIQDKNDLRYKITKLDEQMTFLAKEIMTMQSDQRKAQEIQKKISDNKKEIFKIPKNFVCPHTIREEYEIWEHAINRRMKGIEKIKINTIPYDAIVTINRQIIGTTPLTVDKPLIEDAILGKKYNITIMKKGYETAYFSTSTELGIGSIYEEVELYKRESTDLQTDQLIDEMRQEIKDRSIDLSIYHIEREIEGRAETVLVTQDEMLVMSKDKKNCLLEIPYGAIINAKFDNSKIWGSKAIKIEYNERYFSSIVFSFWIDDNGEHISQSEIKQRSESLVELLNQKKKNSKIYDMPKRIRSPQHFIVTNTDIQNNFSRFEPFEFERLIARLFEKKGYKTILTQERGDFGVDILAEAGGDKLAIQVKHWKANVGGPDINKTLGSMMIYGANRALVVTSSDFTKQAYEIQRRGTPIELWNGKKLRDEFRQHLLDAIKEARKVK